MQTYRLALIGFGNVGQGFAQILIDDKEELSQRYGLESTNCSRERFSKRKSI